MTERAILVSEDQCLRMHGHCFERAEVAFSDPPQYTEKCKHCGKERVAMPREHRDPSGG